MKEKIIEQIKELQKLLNNPNLKDAAKHIAKAFSFSIAISVFVVVITNTLYNEKTVVKRGYVIEIVENNPSKTKNIGGVAVGSLPDLKSAKVDIATLIKNADLKKGKKTFKKCAACHTVEKGGANKIGPNLYAIINKKQAKVADFKYSDALKAKSGRWTYNELNQFLLKPSKYAPGTKMTFAGLKKDKDRANVIAYLKSIK